MPSSPDMFIDIPRAVQLALAPAFLLTGIAGLLNVMAGRLGRIIDRGRALTEGRVPCEHEELVRRIQILERRRRFTSIAITATTVAALLVCAVIAGLFIEVMLAAHLRWLIGSVFTAAMLALVVGLAFFLREVHLAMRSSKLEIHESKRRNP